MATSILKKKSYTPRKRCRNNKKYSDLLKNADTKQKNDFFLLVTSSDVNAERTEAPKPQCMFGHKQM